AAQDNDQVTLLPFTIRKVGDHYLIFRSDTGATVQTTAVGAEAVKMLRNGNSIGFVKASLGCKHGCPAEGVSLTPLLYSLAVKELILNIGTVRFNVKLEPFWLRIWKSVNTLITAKWMSIAVRYLPLSFMLPLLYARLHSRDEVTLKCIEANLARAVSLSLSQQERSIVSKLNYDLLRRSYIDRFLLATLSPRKLGQWFHKYVVISGSNHLDNAIKGGKGIVLCGFHTGSYSLMPFVLAAFGYPITALINAQNAERVTAERTVQHLSSAALSSDLTLVYGNFGIRSLMRAVGLDRIALILPDAFLGQTGNSQLVDFLGSCFRTSAGLAWLCEKSDLDIVIFPIYLQTGHNGRHRLIVDEEITTCCDEQEVIARVYRKLEDVIRNDPS
ncbi:MAG: lysophospholipid acyltransferase family protein, partial [Pyrinomonadaceae bacterium]